MRPRLGIWDGIGIGYLRPILVCSLLLVAFKLGGEEEEAAAALAPEEGTRRQQDTTCAAICSAGGQRCGVEEDCEGEARKKKNRVEQPGPN